MARLPRYGNFKIILSRKNARAKALHSLYIYNPSQEVSVGDYPFLYVLQLKILLTKRTTLPWLLILEGSFILGLMVLYKRAIPSGLNFNTKQFMKGIPEELKPSPFYNASSCLIFFLTIINGIIPIAPNAQSITW